MRGWPASMKPSASSLKGRRTGFGGFLRPIFIFSEPTITEPATLCRFLFSERTVSAAIYFPAWFTAAVFR